ncbi:MAG: PilZ domain-containing protein [Gammaproteobacteria bacterium]|nr:MAG: PilZ domain-containing protein [Gammaproteobacteria bacterium]
MTARLSCEIEGNDSCDSEGNNVMQDNRRQFLRGKIKGVALIYDSKLETTYLMDIGLGGMKVSSKSSFKSEELLWVEFTLMQSTNEMIFGKRAKAKLVYSKFNNANHRFALGFQFLSLTDFQRDVISSALSKQQSS